MDEQQQRELADLIADDERHAATMHKAADYDALMARAEAAEAEVARLQDENAETWFAFDRQQERSNRLAARVAELEAALAAQQWRPIDEPAPKGEIEVKMRCAVTDDGGVYKIRTDIFVGWWTSADDSEWRPLPPAPQETEKPSWQKS